MDNRAESKKALVLEAFNTLSISGTTTLPKHSGRPATGGPKGYIDYDYPEFSRG
jgi:hypothetical protein